MRPPALVVVAAAVVLATASPARPDDGAEIRRELERLKPIVSEIRGLPWVRDVRLETGRRAHDERWMGFYSRDAVTVVEWNPVTGGLLLVHELAHALQDQHSGFPRHRTLDDQDMRLAARAAVEGEAHLVALAYAVRAAGLDGVIDPARVPGVRRLGFAAYRVAEAVGLRPRVAGQPPASRDPFLFPYIHGLAFAQAVVRARGKGLRGLDGVLRDPPVSTEQILHPEKYLSEPRDLPVHVPWPRAPGPGWTCERQEVLGEWGIRVLLEERLGARRAARAAAGWDGDAAAHFRREGGAGPPERLLLWQTVWDSDGDAGEFAGAFRAFSRRRAEVEVGPGPQVRVRWARAAHLH